MFVCYILFDKEAPTGPLVGAVVDFNPAEEWQSPITGERWAHGNFEWNRSVNKNIVYFGLPVETEVEGGYGYDIGMLEDNFTFSITVTNYEEYLYIVQLCKINNGDRSGVLYIGPDDNGRQPNIYEILVRTCTASGSPGQGEMMRVNLTCTVVSP